MAPRIRLPTATGWLLRRRFRRRGPALVLLALIVGLGGAGAFVALGAAERTANAYSRYLDRADVGDLVINPTNLTTELDDVIRTLPGAAAVSSDALFSATLDEGAPRPLIELEVNQAQVWVAGSVDGRHITMDRPALAEGRLAEGPGEALVSEVLADARDIEVGDVLPVSFWGVPDASQDPDTVVAPLGVEDVEVVGVGMLFPDAALPDDLFELETMIVSSDVAGRYQCLPEAPPPGAGVDEIDAALRSESCSSTFWDYSLELVEGDAGVAAARDAVRRANAEWSPEGTEPLLLDPVVYELAVASTAAQERARVERSVQPIVAALVVLGLAAAVVVSLVAGLAVARDLRRAEADQLQWWQLGLSTAGRTGVVGLPSIGAVATGVVVALGVAWWLSPIAPVGTVRSVEPTPGRQLSSWVWLGALVLVVVLVSGISGLAFRSAQRAGRARARHRDAPLVNRLIRRSARPEIAEGIRAAYGRRGSRLVVAGGGVAAAVLLAAVVFATSLSALVSTPKSYGWPWQLGVISGLGWGGVDLDAVDATLAGRDDIEGWTGLGFLPSVTLDDEPVFSVVGLDRSSPVDLTVIEGRLPRGDREVALGARTARDRGISVGDEVELAGALLESGTATVTGRVVFPALGPLGGERTSPGTGMLLPASILDEGVVDGGVDSVGIIGFVGIGLASGADAEDVRRDLHGDLAAWDAIFADPLVYTEPVRPPEIVDAQSMRAVPLLVGGLLVLAASIGLAAAVVISVRTRRRELAILRALGFTGRQLRDSVRMQSVATMITALIVGVPSGIALGRVAWRAFAAQLGVATEPTVPGVWVLATVAGALVVGLAAAASPARVAARAEPAAELRSE